MEFLADLFSFAFDLLIIYCVVKSIGALLSINRNLEEYRERSQEIRDRLESIIHPVKSETHNGIMYWFDAEDDTFLAQGRDDTELVEHLKQRWMDHVFIIADKFVMAGPDFTMMEIKDPNEIGEMLANQMIKKGQA